MMEDTAGDSQTPPEGAGHGETPPPPAPLGEVRFPSEPAAAAPPSSPPPPAQPPSPPGDPHSPAGDAPSSGFAPGSATGPGDAVEAPGTRAPTGWRSPSALFRKRAPRPSAPVRATSSEAAPKPPPKKKKRRDGVLSALSGALSFALLLAIGAGFGLSAASRKLTGPGPLPLDKVVYIPQTTDAPEISAILEREGVVESWWQMDLATLLEGQRGKIQRGEYQFRQNESLREVIAQMAAGKVLQHKVTIPEGLTSEQIVLRLRDNDILEGDIKDTPKEGALLPDTYFFPRGHSRAKAVTRMQDAQNKVLADIWRRRAADLPIRTPYDLVTLASIVEKETGKAEERPRVAAVFVNRLKKGMRLQSDPTIVYGLVGGKATLGRGLMRSEIDRYTPYNTYAINGLPPGPIANPGRAALEAAANPAHTPDLYFVADGTGGHVFSESLDQHARNVQRWRQIEHDQKDKAPAELDASPPGAAAPEKPTRDRRSDAGRAGRLVSPAGEDFPSARKLPAEDDGATRRFGKFNIASALFLIGSVDDPTEDLTRAPRALRLARPYLANAAGLRRQVTDFDVALRDLSAEPDGSAAAPDKYADLSADGAREMADLTADSGVTVRAGDGAPGVGSASGALATYPVSPTRLAEQRARAIRLGLAPTAEAAPASDLLETPMPDQNPPGPPSGAGRKPVLDASEGTPLDPLKARSWDLLSAKTIPALARQ